MTGYLKSFFIKTAAFSFGCFFLFGCENDEKQIAEMGKKKLAVDTATSIESFLSQGGIVKARLTAPLMLRVQTDTPFIEFPKTLHVDFYSDSTKVESQLSSLYGKYRENENKVLLRDSVVVFNEKGDTLHCQELWWDQQSEKFYTDKPVRIYQKDKRIFGNGLESAQNFSWYKIQNITGIVQVPKEGLPQ